MTVLEKTPELANAGIFRGVSMLKSSFHAQQAHLQTACTHLQKPQHINKLELMMQGAV